MFNYTDFCLPSRVYLQTSKYFTLIHEYYVIFMLCYYSFSIELPLSSMLTAMYCVLCCNIRKYFFNQFAQLASLSSKHLQPLFLYYTSQGLKRYLRKLKWNKVWKISQFIVSMFLDRSIQVLGTLRPLMKFLEVFNSANLHGNQKQVFLNVCKMIAIVLILFEIAIAMVFGVWYCINNNFELKMTATPISMNLYCMQLYLICISFMLKNRKIDTTFDRIQTIINQSKFMKNTPWVSFFFDRLFPFYFRMWKISRNICTLHAIRSKTFF